MKTATADIGSLIDRVNKGEIRLPEIQRGYAWKPSSVAGLLDSLYKRYPSGSLLLWETDKPIEERGMKISGPLEKPLVRPLYLLDGQQRLTSLHRAWTGHERARVVFNVENEKFQIESAATRKDIHWVAVQPLLSGTADTFDLAQSINEGLPHLAPKVIHGRLERVRKIADYVYYVEILDHLPYDEVTEIFVRVNSRGKPLRVTDLALATLSARWPGTVSRFDDRLAQCSAAGFPDLGFAFLTRCLAAFVSETATPKDFASASDERLEEGWKRVGIGIEHTIKLLTGHAYIDASTLIPSANALIPVVVYLGLNDDKPLDDDTRNALLYWLFGAWVQARFSGSSETVIAQDVAAVRSKDSIGRLYSNLGLVGHRLAITEEMLAGRGSTSAYFLFSYLVARKAGANDWWHSVPVSATADGKYKVEYHHIHPRATLKGTYSKAEINDLANLAFISAKANRKISARSPAKYFPEIGDEELRRHCIPLDENLRTADRYPDFARSRRLLLAEAMTEFVNAYRPSFLDETGTALVDPAAGEALLIEAYGTAAEEVDVVLVLSARAQGTVWTAAIPFFDLEQMLNDVSDGRGAELAVGREVVQIDVGAEAITLPLGPLMVYGDLAEWQKVIDRELGDLRAIDELPHVEEPDPWEGVRLDFPILDSE